MWQRSSSASAATDETLPSAGITHSVEHMALTGLGDVPDASDGTSGIATATFTTSGTGLEVKQFFQLLATSLANLPLERLEAELEVLRTEGESRESSPVEALLGFRYGARGYGLIGFNELGLRTVTDEQVASGHGAGSAPAMRRYGLAARSHSISSSHCRQADECCRPRSRPSAADSRVGSLCSRA